METLRLRWADLDFLGRSLIFKDTKNRDPLELPMVPTVERVLRRRLETRCSDVWVFPARNGDNHRADACGSAESRLKETLGFGFSHNDLRRSYLTYAERPPWVSIYTLKRLVNHRTGGDVTEGYLGSDPERLREAAQAIEGAFGGP
ncbi:hypothetical protein IB286_08690 [Spongiibacter sp. KMU-158]|uniref:Tyr recombinase domain-containing protein n=2 Tax=Spongiibacter pelagi TaxID=2760804 RepID=A0A927GW49_9GAMM|nr:hypothetical protein [Spongiibacter pelagi]